MEQEIDKIAEECKEPGWDGYLGLPVTAESVEAAKKFWRSIQDKVPQPEIAPLADGSISFEWHWGKDRQFALEATQEALYYAWIDRGHKKHGAESFTQKSVEEVIEIVNMIAK